MTTTEIPALIFDLDGTLWNTVDLCVRAWNRALQELDIPRSVSAADLQGVMGLNAEETRDRLFYDLPREQGNAAIARAFDKEVELLTTEGGTLYPGVREGVTRLAAHLPLYLVSNCEVPYLEVFFSSSGLSSLFKDSECYGRTGRSKGENIRSLMDRNDLHTALYVGDTESDRVASHFAGIPFAYMTYGFGSPRDYTVALDTFDDLVRYVLDSRS
jgi:phosphoglycolate phosphatase